MSDPISVAALNSLPQVSLNLMLERTADQRSVASVLELPDCRVEASTDEQAIRALRQMVINRLANVRILPLDLSPVLSHPENPWIEFIGMFAGDPDFAAIAVELQLARSIALVSGLHYLPAFKTC